MRDPHDSLLSLSLSFYLLTISYLQGTNTQERGGDIPGRDAKGFPSHLLSRISFRSFRSLGKRKGDVGEYGEVR